ncbi:fimbrial biogenesis outer membrane usher protein, partial [Escherichia coli]|nr:fimbrial biogenesis outer membrane usher protein [Escherichia coli]
MNKTIFALILTSIINAGDSFAKEYKFNYRYLGMDENADLNFFDSKTTQGNYVIDIYINNELKETTEIYFRNKSNNLSPCLTQENLIKYGFL